MTSRDLSGCAEPQPQTAADVRVTSAAIRLESVTASPIVLYDAHGWRSLSGEPAGPRASKRGHPSHHLGPLLITIITTGGASVDGNVCVYGPGTGLGQVFGSCTIASLHSLPI